MRAIAAGIVSLRIGIQARRAATPWKSACQPDIQTHFSPRHGKISLIPGATTPRAPAFAWMTGVLTGLAVPTINDPCVGYLISLGATRRE